jgi:hypothetical protein
MVQDLAIRDNFAALFDRAEQLKEDMKDAIDVAVMKITDGGNRDIRLNHAIVCDDGFAIEYVGVDPFGDGIILFSRDIEHIRHGAVALHDDCINIEITLGILTMLNADAYTINNN